MLSSYSSFFSSCNFFLDSRGMSSIIGTGDPGESGFYKLLNGTIFGSTLLDCLRQIRFFHFLVYFSCSSYSASGSRSTLGIILLRKLLFSSLRALYYLAVSGLLSSFLSVVLSTFNELSNFKFEWGLKGVIYPSICFSGLFDLPAVTFVIDSRSLDFRYCSTSYSSLNTSEAMALGLDISIKQL